MIPNLTAQIRVHWFWPVVAALFTLCWGLASTYPAEIPANWEWAFIIDVFVTVPALYMLCYRGRLSRSALILRIIALQCLGLWLAGRIVPEGGQVALAQLSWVRNVGLAILILIEIRLAIALIRIVFRPGVEAIELEKQGIPPPIAKLMLIEARFWRWLFGRDRR